MTKKKRPKSLLKWMVPIMLPLLFFLLLTIILMSVMLMPSPNVKEDLIPTYKRYADMMGADWQLLVAYDLAVHKNQADELDPESAAWFFLRVYHEDLKLNNKAQIISYLNWEATFEEAMNYFNSHNQRVEREEYDIQPRELVTLEAILPDKEYEWVEALVSNNTILKMAGNIPYFGQSYSKLVFENKGFFGKPLAEGTFTVSKRAFGYRMHPIKKKMKFHSGQDFGAAMGTPVAAVADGTAITRWDPDGYGSYIIVSHSNGMTSLYAHLSLTRVGKRQSVQKGQIIGLVGSTGLSTGPHLHFEIRKNGQYLDPMRFLK